MLTGFLPSFVIVLKCTVLYSLVLIEFSHIRGKRQQQLLSVLAIELSHESMSLHCFFFVFIEFSHKLMSKIQPVVTRQKNTIWKERTYDVLSIQRENDNGTKQATCCHDVD